ncbi:MAG: hypothetical protein R3349_10285, partial [Geminicoccaceae bacterium]|nr:hypothetical protein [Geminicoccaceae bacterium]
GQSLAAFLGDDAVTVAFEDKRLGRGDNDFNDTLLTIEPVDPDGTSLVFNDLTPGLDDVLAGIASDPPAAEKVPQVDGAMAVAPIEPVHQAVTVEPDPALVA